MRVGLLCFLGTELTKNAVLSPLRVRGGQLQCQLDHFDISAGRELVTDLFILKLQWSVPGD